LFALVKKEIRSFLSSLIGYIVIAVFLLLTGLFTWVFSGDMNLLDGGYANLNTLFNIAPWVFLFLIPAVCMRLFADEQQLGTLETLLTKPLSELQIVLAKYFAGLSLVIFALLPTLIYYYSVYQLGAPTGNLDGGGIMGSYLGLLFLAAGFVAIGVFASAISNNQVIAFLLAIFICFLTFIGFDYLAEIPFLSPFDAAILKLGINQHYLSMSRGVIDTRDVIYFISLIVIFVILTKTKLESRKW
jgi:ABC-2 type transport system permease protein